jgi:hypothetical protein
MAAIVVVWATSGLRMVKTKPMAHFMFQKFLKA